VTRDVPKPPDFRAIDASAASSAQQRTEVLALIGNLVFTWSNNESMFIYVLMLLLRVDFPTAAITFVSLNTTRARLDLIRRLAKAKCDDAATVKTLERLMERFNDCTKVRNDFNHCIYQLDESGRITHTNVLRIVEDKKGLRFADVRAVDRKRLDEVANTIKKLTVLNRDLWAFLAHLEASLKPGRPPAR
jgi:DNA integrity scanning protein DisA with diadenylate cyclase activity